MVSIVFYSWCPSSSLLSLSLSAFLLRAYSVSGPFLRGQSSEYEKVLHGAYKIERKTHAHIQKLVHDIKKEKKNSQVALVVKNPPAMQETQEMGFDPWLGKIPWRRKWQSTAVPVWRISWTQGPGRLPIGLLRVAHNWATNTHTKKNKEWQGNAYCRCGIHKRPLWEINM